MFDYHIHSRVSFDSGVSAIDCAIAAREQGLTEIAFTDHYDFNSEKDGHHDLFTAEDYFKEYGNIHLDGLSIKRGVEFGLTEWNAHELSAFNQQFKPDFIIGSVHYVDGFDPYYEDFWIGKDTNAAYLRYLEHTLCCCKAHSDFDVLGHINYICKSLHNPTRSPLNYLDYSDICDDIMRDLIHKGRGLEINTSGIDRVGAPLPDATFLRRFRELGGEIVTVGSDAHTADRVGQYIPEALATIKDIFGYVCTFDRRHPIFHKL